MDKRPSTTAKKVAAPAAATTTTAKTAASARPVALPASPELLGLDEAELDAEISQSNATQTPSDGKKKTRTGKKKTKAMEDREAHDEWFPNEEKEVEFLYNSFAVACGVPDPAEMRAREWLLECDDSGMGQLSRPWTVTTNAVGGNSTGNGSA